MARTSVLIADHIQPIVDFLTAQLGVLSYPIPVGFGERPIGDDKLHEPPPYLFVTYLPGGTLDGPLSDSQADVSIRILLFSAGKTAREATVLRDIAHQEMHKENFTVSNRKIRNLIVETPSDGTYRDDDAPSPIFYTRQIYLMDTTPS
jgi:hypothetical protein